MYLFGDSYFELTVLKNVFQAVFIFYLFSEICLLCFTGMYGRKKSGNGERADRGSCLLIVAGFMLIMGINLILRKHTPYVMPVFLFWAGIVFTLAGIIVRVYSVWTLRRFFTFSVRVRSGQKIIQSGPYRLIRHPAYSGSILSLTGIAMCFRSVLGLMGTLVVIAIVYGYRISVEEKALERNFKTDYTEYKKRTRKIIPFLL